MLVPFLESGEFGGQGGEKSERLGYRMTCCVEGQHFHGGARLAQLKGLGLIVDSSVTGT
jgi:hypothetical protein